MGRGLDGFLCYPDVTLCGFEGPPGGFLSPVSGGYGEGETPLPIPNRAVKPLSADGTWPSRARESRTPPVFLHEPPIGRLVVVLERDARVRPGPFALSRPRAATRTGRHPPRRRRPSRSRAQRHGSARRRTNFLRI